jgi:AbrB family looped-hinge helix DNA binding protein
MITATVTAKGQITIPAEIREALTLDAGDRIVFEEGSRAGLLRIQTCAESKRHRVEGHVWQTQARGVD